MPMGRDLLYKPGAPLPLGEDEKAEGKGQKKATSAGVMARHGREIGRVGEDQTRVPAALSQCLSEAMGCGFFGTPWGTFWAGKISKRLATNWSSTISPSTIAFLSILHMPSGAWAS